VRGADASIDHSTFTDNRATGGGGAFGGALGNYDSSDLKVSWSTFTKNSAGGRH
jgi:hypothetical protein